MVEGGVYFDVFRQTSRCNLRQSKQSSFYVFGVFVDGRGGSIMTYVNKVRVVICAHQNRVHSMFLEFLLIYHLLIQKYSPTRMVKNKIL